jgi:hypothetical protein
MINLTGVERFTGFLADQGKSLFKFFEHKNKPPFI